MNSKIPFEVVNSNADTCETSTDPILNTDFPIQPTEFAPSQSDANSSVDEPLPEVLTETAKPAKKLKAKKLKGQLKGHEVEAALVALAELPELSSLPSDSKAAGLKSETCMGDDESVVETVQTEMECVAETTEPELADEMDLSDESFESSAFEEFGLLPSVVAAIDAAGYSVPTPIQTETIPHILAGKDIIGRAETGSGKTAAFACPLLSMIDVDNKSPQVLVLTPTRELAIQVTSSFEKYGAELKGFRTVTIYGGQSYEPQTNALRRGVQVVVGTPGRVMDHLRQGTLNLSQLKTIVLDEADEMLRMGFIDDVEWILEQIPSERQTLLFSATMPAPIQKIAQQHLRKPVNVSIESDTATAESIAQSCVLVQPRTKLDMLAQILESEETDGVIVFVKTRDTTVGIADQLSQRGFSAAPLNGEIPQNQRERTIEHLKSGRLNVLVATDVAARGLDVQRISHVINFDFPHDTEAYVHRIGRTGRAGRDGTAILFVEPKEQGKLKRLQRETNQQIDNYRQKSIKELNQIRIQKFKQKISESLANQAALTLFSEIVTQFQRETELPFEQIAVGLAAMAQGDVPLLLKEVVNARSNWKTDVDKKGKRFQGEMATYRVEVGRNHGVGPGNIVGAITNEVALDYAAIGRIKLFDDFSTIDLPANLPAGVLDDLKSVVVSGQRLQITRDRRAPDRGSFGRSSSERGERRTERGGERGADRVKRSRRDGEGSTDRSQRPARHSAGFESAAQERPKRFAERTGKPDRSERFQRPERSERAERSGTSLDRPRKFGKPDRPERGSSRTDRFSSTKSEKFGRTERNSSRSRVPRSEAVHESRSSKPAGVDAKRSDKKPQRKFVKLRGTK